MDFKFTKAASGVNGAAILQVNGYGLSPQKVGSMGDVLPIGPSRILKNSGAKKITTSDTKYGKIFLNSLSYAIQNVVFPEEPIQAVIRVGFDTSRGAALLGKPKPVTFHHKGLSFLFLFNVEGSPAGKTVLTPSALSGPLAAFYEVLDVTFDLEASPDEFLAAFFSAYPPV